MNAVIITAEAFASLQSQLTAIQAKLDAPLATAKDTILDNDQFVKLMGIHRRTAQNWRDAGLINFSQIGAKVYYRMADVEKFLESHRVKAFNRK